MNQVPHGDDAVFEVELSPQELRALTQTRARAGAPTHAAGQAVAAKAAVPGRRSVPRVTVGLGAASVIAVAVLFVAHRTPDITQPIPAPPVSAAPALAIAAPSTSAEPVASPVKFANPFDRAEVFEFPAGTSRAEARQKVAEVLLKRAQERRPTLRRVASIERSGTARRAVTP